jgi:hypothetical protein
VGEDLHQPGGAVLAAGASDGDGGGAGREHRVVHEVVDELVDLRA